jgi:hypothetical protein
MQVGDEWIAVDVDLGGLLDLIGFSHDRAPLARVAPWMRQ